MQEVQGRAQHYDWGDADAIPALLGLEADGRPWAEFWWGTHPSAPSTVAGAPLVDSTGPLPFLVKLLAAARPLSLQLHPDAEQAAMGYAREQAAGLALDDPTRTYRDPWPKPEMVIALTRFEAVCGFASDDVVRHRLEQVGRPGAPLLQRFVEGGHRAVVTWLLTARPDLGGLAGQVPAITEPWARWLSVVARLHPGDPAVGVLPLLHHVVLEPGGALFLGAGHLHAYLHGVGVEVMGPSDNVVRAGLTSKYVDTDAVVALMRGDVLRDPVLLPRRERHGDAEVLRYSVAEAPFEVERWALDGAAHVTANGDELWWCASGDVGIGRQGSCVLLRQGETALLEGRGSAFRVTGATRRPSPGRAGAPELRSDDSSPGGPTPRH